jgi:hypothetical protein
VKRTAAHVFSTIVAIYYPFCTASVRQTLPPSEVHLAELWQRPEDLASRDLFYGAWGREDAPDAQATYTFVQRKQEGTNPGVTVGDPLGREWHVKQPPHNGQGAERPIEVVLSRVLSAVSYHQPPVYFLPSFTLTDVAGTSCRARRAISSDREVAQTRGHLVVAAEPASCEDSSEDRSRKNGRVDTVDEACARGTSARSAGLRSPGAHRLNRSGRSHTLGPWTGCLRRSPSSSCLSPAGSTGTAAVIDYLLEENRVLPEENRVLRATPGADGFASRTTSGAAWP